MDLRFGAGIFAADGLVIAECTPHTAVRDAETWTNPEEEAARIAAPTSVRACTPRDLAAARVAVESGADVLDSDDPGVIELAARTGTGLVCAPEAIDRARAAGVRPDGLLVRLDGPVRAAEVAARATGGPPILLDADAQADHPAGRSAAAAVHAWCGARVFRTTRPVEIADAITMVAVIRGTRQPAVTRRCLV